MPDKGQVSADESLCPVTGEPGRPASEWRDTKRERDLLLFYDRIIIFRLLRVSAGAPRSSCVQSVGKKRREAGVVRSPGRRFLPRDSCSSHPALSLLRLGPGLGACLPSNLRLWISNMSLARIYSLSLYTHTKTPVICCTSLRGFRDTWHSDDRQICC